MTLEEAIKRNQIVATRLTEQSWPFDAQAVLIGIEAIKAIRWIRGHPILPEGKLLPGETKE